MIRRLLFLGAMAQTCMTYGQVTAGWLQQASFFGAENIRTMSFIPGNATGSAAVWHFADGAISTGPGGTVLNEYRLMAYNAASGAAVFDQEVKGIDIYKIAFDPELDQVMLLINAEPGPDFIGQNAITAVGSPDCQHFALLRFNRSGVLLATQWLPFPCTHPRAGGLAWDIDVRRQRVALSMPVYGDLDTDSTTFSFGTHSRMLRKDSTYISIFQWDYAGIPQQLDMFVQPIGFNDRSYVTAITYGDKGDLCLLGNLVSDIRFGSFNLSKAANETATFMARIRTGGPVAVAKKVFTSTVTNLGPLGLTYNPLNKQLYFMNDWSDKLTINGSLVQRGSSGMSANVFLASTDSNLVTQNFTTVRYADTAGSKSSAFFSFNALATDATGNIVLAASMTDSFRVEQKTFRSNTVNDDFNVAVLRFDKDLKLDTCMRSEGTGSEQSTCLALGTGQDIYIGGVFIGPLVFPPLSGFPLTSIEDAFVVKLNMKRSNTTGLPDIEGPGAWSLYPNPASANVSVALDGMLGISVYAADGKRVYHQVFNGSRASCEIDISGLSRGVYFVKAALPKGISRTRSFVKE